MNQTLVPGRGQKLGITAMYPAKALRDIAAAAIEQIGDITPDLKAEMVRRMRAGE